MDEILFKEIAVLFGWSNYAQYQSMGYGLINSTWKVVDGTDEYVLQQLNNTIFKKPQWIDENINCISHYLKQQQPDYLFTAPVATVNGNTLIKIDEKYFRAFTFIKNSHTIDAVQNPQQAYVAAFQFGRFTALLHEFNATQLKITLPNFHNLSLRYQQFETIINNGNVKRITAAKDAIGFIQSQKNIVGGWQQFINNKESKQRVTHHDTKIANVLFDENNKGLCVIDLDTVMPGYFMSDVGDMLRTYTCPVNEEATDLNTITVRKDYLKVIHSGYLALMEQVLTNFEKDHFYFAGEVLIYMQALRFLTDYLNNDSYYGSKYEGHNFNRAKNQIQLLQAYQLSI